jgi:hypothetical protein
MHIYILYASSNTTLIKWPSKLTKCFFKLEILDIACHDCSGAAHDKTSRECAVLKVENAEVPPGEQRSDPPAPPCEVWHEWKKKRVHQDMSSRRVPNHQILSYRNVLPSSSFLDLHLPTTHELLLRGAGLRLHDHTRAHLPPPASTYASRGSWSTVASLRLHGSRKLANCLPRASSPRPAMKRSVARPASAMQHPCRTSVAARHGPPEPNSSADASLVGCLRCLPAAPPRASSPPPRPTGW